MNNRDEIRAKMEEQRKWRERKAQPTRLTPKRSFPVMKVMVFLIAVLGSMYAIWILPQPSAKAIEEPITVETVATPQPQTSTTCAGFSQAKIHVRFEAGMKSDVRGYLSEGETVTFLLDNHGQTITKDMDDVHWAYITSPIQGWVSTSFLCK